MISRLVVKIYLHDIFDLAVNRRRATSLCRMESFSLLALQTGSVVVLTSSAMCRQKFFGCLL